MASPTQLIEKTSGILGISQAACESTWKELRSRNLVVNSGRGKRGTQVSARDCAAFLLALCGADHVKRSAKAVDDYGNCILDNEGEPIDFQPLQRLGAHHTLLSAVAAIIEAYRLDDIPVKEVRLVLPDGGRGPKIKEPIPIMLYLTNPPPSHPARISIADNKPIVAVYFHRRKAEEMFAGVHEGSKQRLSAKGDLQIEKRVSSATFRALGELLREESK